MDPEKPPSLIERFSALLSPEPEDREELLALLRSACERDLLDIDALSIMEGALQMSDLHVRDIMIDRARIHVLRINDPLEKIVDIVINTGHSRFPVIGEDSDDVVGILLAKDLLRYFTGREFDLRKVLRPAVFLPESKRLNVLLREFRSSHNHMAIIVDEYGGISGLVTIEDVLEQIVGDIEDEFDEAESAGIQPNGGGYEVQASASIDALNATFGTDFEDDEYDTVGGLVLHTLNHLPENGEELQVGDLHIRVLKADGRRIHTLLIERREP